MYWELLVACIKVSTRGTFFLFAKSETGPAVYSLNIMSIKSTNYYLMLICGIHYFTEVEQDAAMEENSKLQVKVVQFLSHGKRWKSFPSEVISFLW